MSKSPFRELERSEDEQIRGYLSPAELLEKIRSHLKQVIVHPEQVEISWTPKTSPNQKISTISVPFRI